MPGCHRPSLALSWIFAVVLAALPGWAQGATPTLPNPVLFVAQVPIPGDFASIGSTFGNQSARIETVGRGGDLYILYPDGTLRNLTREAGFGDAGDFQGAEAIAVRDPSVHWDGTRALFSMVIGGPDHQYELTTEYWQIYEITGLGQAEAVAITKVPYQPADTNNVTPLYSPDGRILFTSDRPRNGQRHLYPQHDEYESTATNTGIWSLDPVSGDLAILDHAPSGDFTPILDSYGRVIFTRWDHLQRDQQADADAGGGEPYGTFNYADESAGAAKLANRNEVFPEPRPSRTDLLAGTNLVGHRFNHFFPWEMRPDGTALETLNHVGRHELHTYFTRSFDDDPNLVDFSVENPDAIESLFEIEESPTVAGLYFGVESPEFATHASGQIVTLNGPQGLPADQMTVTQITHPDTRSTVPDATTPPVNHSGHYRDPLPLSNGGLIAAHTFETRAANNDGTRANPVPRYLFRLRWVVPGGMGYSVASPALTAGISRRVQYWDPDVLVTYDGPLWELSPVEVRVGPEPPLLTGALEAPEAQILSEENVDLEKLRADLRARGLALVISRNLTTRDAADRQQPFNLAVAGSGTQTIPEAGKVYDLAHIQFFQGDQIRGIGGLASPRPGRRVLAQAMHDPAVDYPPATSGPAGSVAIAADGSMAALVPAQRAMSWQLTDPAGTPVVRERYWLTFQPGEIRVCTSCHGLNSADQAGLEAPQNPPAALRTFLKYWSTLFANGFEGGSLGAWSSSVP